MKKPLTIRFHATIHRLQHLLNVHYVEVTPAELGRLGIRQSVRLKCVLQGVGKVNFQCGLVALGNGSFYITINNGRLKTLGRKEGQSVDVSLQLDESEFGMEMPDALAELFAQDFQGYECFKHLPAGKQRYVIYHVSQVKNQQLRVNRAITLIENLKKYPLGKATFRQMLGLD